SQVSDWDRSTVRSLTHHLVSIIPIFRDAKILVIIQKRTVMNNGDDLVVNVVR
ncbi:MAG: hypothetical protein RLY42_408, partial [Pseudomonadota bacterium]